MKKSIKRNYGAFYGLLRMQPNYNPNYADVMKEGIISEFTQRVRGVHNESLRNLSETEYNQLIDEMRKTAVQAVNPHKVVNNTLRREWVHKILNKFSEMGVSTANGYDDVNFHMRRLKGFNGRIIPEYKTNELNNVFLAVCNYVDGYKKQQRKHAAIVRLN